MKIPHSLLMLLYITISLSLPIQILFTDGTPTIRAGNSLTSQSREKTITDKSQTQEQPSTKTYTDQPRDPYTAADQITTSDSATASPISNLGADGTLLGKFISNDDHPKYKLAQSPATNANPTRETIVTRFLAKFVTFLDEHESLCRALGLLTLVPIAYLIFTVVELACKACTQRQFARQRRVRVRLVGPERQLHASNKRRREIVPVGGKLGAK